MSDAEKIKVLTEALRFYADRGNYFTQPGGLSAIWRDCGNTAVEAMSQTNE